MNIKTMAPKLTWAFAACALMFFGCSKNDDAPQQVIEEPIALNNPINEFVWSGLNEIYLWKDDVPKLADDAFKTQDEFYTFLNQYNSPEETFDNLLYRKGEVDKFSFIVDDYEALENSFQGNSFSSGLDFRLVRLSGNSNEVFGYVRYVANNSDAASKDIKRGDFFLTVNGTQLNTDNFSDLLFGSNNNLTLGMAEINNGSIALNGKEVGLTKTDFTENPILLNDVITMGDKKIGYLMYNSFIANFDDELNTAFADFKAQGITDLVLDLRYNGGGRVSSAIILASMITGQFDNEVFSTEVWNNKYQTYFEQNAPQMLVNTFTNKLLDDTPIAKLNLSKVYVLTTSGTASASELVINGLIPYIDVVQIGTNTTGKYTASVTLYDSENFSREKANPNHKYALQPLVFKSANADGTTDYFNGLPPTHKITYQTSSGAEQEGENILNMGVLGDVDEPFLNKAIELITGTTGKSAGTQSPMGVAIKHIADSKDFTPLGKEMYKDMPILK